MLGKVSLEELKTKMRELENAYNPIITKAYAALPHESVPGQEGASEPSEQPDQP
jgi:hypothetical protein